MNMKILNDSITSNYTNKNSNICSDNNTLSSHSNDSHSNYAIKDDNNKIIHININLIPSANIMTIDKCSSKNIGKKLDANFD